MNLPVESMNERLKRHKDILMDFNVKILPRSDASLIYKKNAWIVFLLTDDGKIYDLSVFDCNEYRKEKIVSMVERYCQLTPYRDFGNCLADWDDWSLAYILFRLGWHYGFAHPKIMKRSLEDLSLIFEFEEEIKEMLRGL